MKITLYIASTLDGFIADKNNDSTWVSNNDAPEFQKQLIKKKVCLMGSNTYKFAIIEKIFPFKCEKNIIFTNQIELLKKNLTNLTNAEIYFTKKKPENILKQLSKLKYKEALLIGGSKLNTHFLKNNLIDKIIISLHPILLERGIPIFQNKIDLQKLGFKTSNVRIINNELVQIHYLKS